MKSLLISSVVAIGLIATSAHADKRLCKGLLADIHNQTIASEVQSLEAELDRERSETAEIRSEAKETNQDIDNIEKDLNWFQRVVFSWLAKLFSNSEDDALIDLRDDTEDILEDLEDKLAKDERQDAAADRRVIDALNNYFASRSKKFRELRKSEDQLNDLICEGDRCLREIRDATSSIDTALMYQNMHNNTHIIENAQDRHNHNQQNGLDFNDVQRMNSRSRAKMDTHQAFDVAKNFMYMVQQLRDDINVGLATQYSDSPTDMIIDIATISGLDNVFFDHMQTQDLHEKARQLSRLRGKIETIKRQMKSERRRLIDVLNAVICEGRDNCKMDPDKSASISRQ